MEEEKFDEIKEIIEQNETEFRRMINSFFDILFWKDYVNGYLEIQDKRDILEKIRKNTKYAGYDGTDYQVLDTEGILPFVNRIRKQIGLPELKFNKSMGRGLEEVKE